MKKIYSMKEVKLSGELAHEFGQLLSFITDAELEDYHERKIKKLMDRLTDLMGTIK